MSTQFIYPWRFYHNQWQAFSSSSSSLFSIIVFVVIFYHRPHLLHQDYFLSSSSSSSSLFAIIIIIIVVFFDHRHFLMISCSPQNVWSFRIRSWPRASPLVSPTDSVPHLHHPQHSSSSSSWALLFSIFYATPWGHKAPLAMSVSLSPSLSVRLSISPSFCPSII